MATYNTVVLAQRPKGDIKPGETFKIKTEKKIEESQLEDGQFLVEVHYLSLDPAMRSWLNDMRSYLPPVPIGGVMRGSGVGKVVASKSAKYPVGTYVSSFSGWTEFAVLNDSSMEVRKVEVPEGVRLTDALGVLGTTGLTAYFGLLNVGQVKAGDFVVVSGAAGATGSVVCQIAKLKGARVLGIAGSDDKVAWLRELGCDDALNYKDSDFAAKFKESTKDFIDLYFDNVGGEILDLALLQAKQNARFVICGGISQYNATERTGIKNFHMITVMRIRVQGFIVFDFASQYAAAREELSQWLSEGKIQRKETIIKGGLPAAEQALIDLYKGINTGKLLLEVKPDDEKGAKL